MAPPLSPSDREEIARLIARAVEEKSKPIERRLKEHSGQYREIVPEVRRTIRDSQHDLEDRSMGFEKLMLDSMAMQAQRIEEVAKSIPPVANAAVAGAQASQRAEGRTEAVQVAADRADKNSLAAKVKANQTLLVVIGGIVVQVLYNAYEHIIHVVVP